MRLALVALLLLSQACWLLPAARAGSKAPSLEKTPEWGRLVTLWHAMLDHSSDLVYSPARFQELAKQMDAVDADVAELVKAGLLSVPVAAGLARLFHDRYQYILTRHYTSQSEIKLSGLEAAAAASHWIVELQLGVLRRGSVGPDGRPAPSDAIESTIAYELSFLEEYNRFEAEVEKRREVLAQQQAAGKEVDTKAFDDDCERRRLLLLEAYQGHRIRVSRSVRSLLPQVMALTRSRPAALAPAPAAAGP